MLLFDIDLTLLFTGGVGRFAINNAFKEIFGVDEAWGSTQPDGKTDSRIFGEIALRVLGRSLKKKETALLLEKYRLVAKIAATATVLLGDIRAQKPLFARQAPE